MKKTIKGLIIMTIMGLTAFGALGCANKAEQTKDEQDLEQLSYEQLSYEQLTAEQAKKLMDTENGYIILDVRTDSEFAEGHIKNALLIPDYEISERAESMLKDKNQLILVYCRSGRRSKLAAQALADLGYTNVKEFGGIIDWKYDITTE